MPTGTRRRRAVRVIGGALVAAALGATAVGVGGLARPEPAGALPLPIVDDLLGGITLPLAAVVGAVDATVKQQLPANPKIYGAYTSRPTPEKCQDGNAGCIDTTIADMNARFESLVPSCDHSALFSLLYMRVTQRYKEYAETPGTFDSVATVNHEDAIFYDLYGSTFGEWRAGHPEKVPPIWRLAYATADARQAFGTGDLLLGMAAHILRDLPFTLYHVGTVTRHDHVTINPMLESVYSSVVLEAAQRFDPTVQLGDLVPGTRFTVVQIIAQWRDKAWRDAQALAAAPSASARQQVANRIEREAWATGLTVYLGLRYPAQQATVTRDAYCAQHAQAG
jgi:Family of unknown function (DUF5995)